MSHQRPSERNPAGSRGAAKVLTDTDAGGGSEFVALYRDTGPNVQSDSADSSLSNSLGVTYDQGSYMENLICFQVQSPFSDIADSLSRMKINAENKPECHSDAAENLTTGYNFHSNSIISRNTPEDSIYHRTVNTLADTRFSEILAGRLDNRENVEASGDDQSLLNIAINESRESNMTIIQLSSDEESDDKDSHLSASSSHIGVEYERDSLESEGHCIRSRSKHHVNFSNVQEKDLYESDIIDTHPNRQQPRIVSNEKVDFCVNLVKPLSIVQEESVSKDKNDNIQENASVNNSVKEHPFISVANESEQLITANIRTPNLRALQFIENCYKSSPKVGVNADTFGSDLISDISNLSAICNSKLNSTSYHEVSPCKAKIFKRMSQQFVQSPTKFTKELITLIEESVLQSQLENAHASDVSLSRLTEEFRKICQYKRIEDESVPESAFGTSFQILPSQSRFKNQTVANVSSINEETALSPKHNFTKFGGGKKVYRKTPRRVFKPCTMPNCANVSPGTPKTISDTNYSPNVNNSTATFELWENLCCANSPTKQVEQVQTTDLDVSEILSMEDYIRKSDRQMASLEESNQFLEKIENGEKQVSHNENVQPTLKKSQAQSGTTVVENNGPNENIMEVNGEENCQEMDKHGAARRIEKRRKCFEEARKVFEQQQSSVNARAPSKVSASRENQSSLESVCDAGFLSTLSACVDYFDEIRTIRNLKKSLQCILECSEDTESVKETTEDSRSLEYVEAIILPVKNRENIQGPKSSVISNPDPDVGQSNLITQTHLYLSGSPRSPNPGDRLKSPMKNRHLSPGNKRSPGTRAASVLAKKIKSPVSPSRRQNVHRVKTIGRAQQPEFTTPENPRTNCENKRRALSGRSRNKPTAHPSLKVKPAASSPGLTDVTNINKAQIIPKLIVSNSTPCNSKKTPICSRNTYENAEIDCQKKLGFSESVTPKVRKTKFFVTPTKSNEPARAKMTYNKRFFDFRTPAKCKVPSKSPSSPGIMRVNYDTVESPVAMYIKGTEPNLIKNVKSKTNERMLTPRSITPKSRSKISSPILARSPRLSPTRETARLKFELSPAKKMKGKQEFSDIFNTALCESDPSSIIGTESTSKSPFPNIFYKPASCVKMVEETVPKKRRPKVLSSGPVQKLIYRHEGRLKSTKQAQTVDSHRLPHFDTTKSSSQDSGDISVLHQSPATKTNYLIKKK
ncbi:uncharacterized protein LOC124415968 [Diprion similis]|uniref:uncharacterized protein LOC124415968 n=1 Tax=Diprion similis TaxID=362088 RepID=UPI001EF98BA5|nr:uncharacterized protein LOC124415968 [Diprion similis]